MYQFYEHVMVIVSTMMSVFIMATEYYDIPTYGWVIFHIVDCFILFLALAHIILEVFAFGLKNFVRHRWHLYVILTE